MVNKQKCIFVSNYVESKEFERIYTKPIKPGIQIQKFDRLIVEGLEQNDVNVVCYSTIPVSKVVLDKKILKLKNTDTFHYSLCINIPILKDIYVLIGTSFKLLFTSFDYCVLDPLSPANTLAASLVCKLKHKECNAVITDLPEFMTSNKLYRKITNMVISNSSSYTFLSSKMNDRLNKKNKPYVIVEGFADDVNPKEYEHNNEIVYAGNLSVDNGVMNLVNAFRKSSFHESCLLRLFGNGNATDLINEIEKDDKHIKYEGVRPNKEVLEVLYRAKLLINPRPTNEEFTFYSFPSKTIEYLGTGTPFASTELYAIDKEYFNYIESLKNGTEEELLNFFNHFNDIDYSSRLDKARKGKEFIALNKNKKAQTKKMLTILDRNK